MINLIHYIYNISYVLTSEILGEYISQTTAETSGHLSVKNVALILPSIALYIAPTIYNIEQHYF